MKVETEALIIIIIIIIFTVNLGLSDDLEWNKFTVHGLYGARIELNQNLLLWSYWPPFEETVKMKSTVCVGDNIIDLNNK